MEGDADSVQGGVRMMIPTTDPASKDWHLDRRIPLTLIATIVIQTLVVASVLTQKSIQIDDHERRIDRQEVSTRTLDAAVNEFVRRAGQRQITLEEHTVKLQKLESSDALTAAHIAAILQQLARIDERTVQLASTLLDLRNEVRRQRADRENLLNNTIP